MTPGFLGLCTQNQNRGRNYTISGGMPLRIVMYISNSWPLENSHRAFSVPNVKCSGADHIWIGQKRSCRDDPGFISQPFKKSKPGKPGQISFKVPLCFTNRSQFQGSSRTFTSTCSIPQTPRTFLLIWSVRWSTRGHALLVRIISIST